MIKLDKSNLKEFNGVYYCLNTDGKGVTLLGCTETADTIPSKIEGLPVTHFELAWIPDTRIKWHMKDITLPNNVIVGRQALAYSPVEKLHLTAGVVLRSQAFEACRYLKELIFDSGVIFDDRPALKKAQRGATGYMLFETYDLAEQPDAPRLWVECFDNKMTTKDMMKDGFACQRMNNVGVFSSCEALTEVVIPEGVRVLPQFTFGGCFSLCKVTLPSTLQAISACCFAGCKNLVNIVIPDGVKLIGEQAFWGCGKLETVVLPGGLTNIVKDAFSGCKSLSRIFVPAGMKEIDGTAELEDALYRYASHFNVEYDTFSKEDFYSKKSWKKIFGTKASKVTDERPPIRELLEQTNQAIASVLQQSGFDKLKEDIPGITECIPGMTEGSSKCKRKDMKALQKQLTSYIDAMQYISKQSYGDCDLSLAQVKVITESINEFDAKFMVIETEDRDSLCMVIEECAVLAGFPFPKGDDYFDITEQWRQW